MTESPRDNMVWVRRSIFEAGLSMGEALTGATLSGLAPKAEPGAPELVRASLPQIAARAGRSRASVVGDLARLEAHGFIVRHLANDAGKRHGTNTYELKFPATANAAASPFVCLEESYLGQVRGAALATLYAIAYHRNGRTGEAFARVATYAKKIEISERTARKAKRTLQAGKLIENDGPRENAGNPAQGTPHRGPDVLRMTPPPPRPAARPPAPEQGRRSPRSYVRPVPYRIEQPAPEMEPCPGPGWEMIAGLWIRPRSAEEEEEIGERLHQLVSDLQAKKYQEATA